MGIPTPLGVGASGIPPAGDQANAVVSGTFAAIGPGLPFSYYGPFNLLIWASINTALTTTKGSTAITAASGTGLAIGAAVNSANLPKGTTLLTINTGTGAGTVALPTVSQPGAISPVAAQITGLATTDGLVGATVTGPGIPSGTTVAAVSVAAVPSVGGAPAILGAVQITNLPTATNPAAPLAFALGTQSITTGVDAAALFTGVGITYVGTVQLERSFDGGATWLCCGISGQSIPASYNAGTPVSVVVGEPERGVTYRLNCIAYTSGSINYRMSATGAAALSLAVASSI